MINKVASIVVTYNRLELLKECIISIRNQTYKEQDIIVVNNGSTDKTSEWLSDQGDLIVINQENVGGAGGFFTGIKFACENGYEFSWIMDDDVISDEYALENMVNKSSLVDGFLCSRVLDIEGNLCNVPKISPMISKITGEPVWGNMLGDKLLKVDITSFVSLFLRNSIVYEKGLPYKEYFIWGDDTEYTSRISETLDSYMVLDSIVVHKRKIQAALSIFKETDSRRMRNYFYSYRNRIHLQRSPIRKILMFCACLLDAFKLLLGFKYMQAWIVIKGSFSAIVFNPKIQYPLKS